MPEVIRCLRPVTSSASAAPRIAKLSDSVPPLVKMTSDGSAPMSAATALLRAVEGGLRLLAVVMNTRRIAEKIPERARHGLGGGRIHRSRGVVIEVDAHG